MKSIPKTPALELKITPWRLARVLAVVIPVMASAGILVRFACHAWGGLYFFINVFDVGSDSSIPTWYSSLALLFCAAISALIGACVSRADGNRLYWYAIAVLMLGMSIDEVAMIHERILGGIGDLILVEGADRSPYLFYSWVILGAPLVLGVVAFMLRFVLRLPSKTRKLVFLSGAVFVAGALGMEVLNSRLHKLSGHLTIEYLLSTALEEFLEMAGVGVFLYALLDYWARISGDGGLRIRFERGERRRDDADEVEYGSIRIEKVSVRLAPVATS